MSFMIRRDEKQVREFDPNLDVSEIVGAEDRKIYSVLKQMYDKDSDTLKLGKEIKPDKNPKDVYVKIRQV